MKTQQHLYYDAVKRNADIDRHFMNMISDTINPLTNDDLSQLIKIRPAIWARFSAFVGKLPN